MRTTIKVLIALTIIATIVNDAGYYFVSLYDLRDTSRQAAIIAADATRSGADANHAWQAAESYASKNDATIYGYDQSPAQVVVWAKAPVRHQWVFPRVYALFTKERQGAPLTIQAEASADIN